MSIRFFVIANSVRTVARKEPLDERGQQVALDRMLRDMEAEQLDNRVIWTRAGVAEFFRKGKIA